MGERRGPGRGRGRGRSQGLHRGSIIALCVLLVYSSVAVVPVAGQSPTVSLTVDGESAQAGAETLVRADPTATISVNSAAPVDLVDVRVNGVIQWSAEPNATSVNETIPLTLESGANDVTVIVNADGVESVSTTVIKDDSRPRVAYTTPFETTALGSAPETVTVETARVDLAGTLVDAAGVERIGFEREYTHTRAGEEKTSRAQHRLREPGESFTQPLMLGTGRNNVTARYTDRFG